MSLQPASSIVLDPQQIQKQFQSRQLLHLKMQQLQTSVFKNFTIKKSKSVIHLFPQKQPSPSPSKALKTTRAKTIKYSSTPSVNNIQFAIRRSDSVSPKKVVSFKPRMTMQVTTSKHMANRQQKLIQKIELLQKNSIRWQLEDRIRQVEKRDSQTLLRKNSLFLFNCLKTRYKDRASVSGSHIGDIAQATHPKTISNFRDKAQGLTHYQQRFEYMQEAKQRMMQAKMLNVKDGSRQMITPLFPEPWQQEYWSSQID